DGERLARAVVCGRSNGVVVMADAKARTIAADCVRGMIQADALANEPYLNSLSTL
ncbi:MAG: hypothetical protein ACI9DC_005154, partial [Gammaproteobacteria bacterium]